MPWLETDVRDQRIQFVLAASRRDADTTALCRAFGISRKTGYKWLRRHRVAGSVAALGDRSRRPRASPTRTDATLTRRVVALRERYGWGGDKLAYLLRTEGIRLAPRSIDRIIQREGLTRADAAPSRASRRFAREAPNELWQLDAKGCYPLTPRGRCHPLSVLDDHSRFAVGLFALPALTTALVQPALIACFERYGLPRALLMDHGTPWWNAANATGLTTLSVFLLKQGIRLFFGRVRHPQTQGKVERFHRTIGERLRWSGVPTALPDFVTALDGFREEYNHVRPHEALGMAPPARHFAPSPRPYRPAPPVWEYPVGSDLRDVDANGMLTYDRQRYFISDALVGERVACTRLHHRVLVVYRHMYVRELHLRAHRSVTLLRPADATPPVTAQTAATGPYPVLPMS